MSTRPLPATLPSPSQPPERLDQRELLRAVLEAEGEQLMGGLVNADRLPPNTSQKVYKLIDKCSSILPLITRDNCARTNEYGDLYDKAVSEATAKQSLWKWKYCRWGGSAGMLLGIGGIGFSVSLLYAFLYVSLITTIGRVMERPNLLKSSNVTLMAVTGGMGGCGIFIFWKMFDHCQRLKNQHSDPYDEHLTKKTKSWTYHYTERAALHNMLYFNFPTFSSDPHYLLRLAYFERMTPEEYGLAKVLTEVVKEWIKNNRAVELLLKTSSQERFDALALQDQNAYVCLGKVYTCLLNESEKNRLFINPQNYLAIMTPVKEYDKVT